MTYDKHLARYFKEAHLIPLLSKEEELQLAILAKQNNIEARNKLVTANLRFVVQVANRYKGYIKPHKYSLLDLIQEGNFGLLQAIDQYAPESGYRFTTYAVYWIKARIMSFIIKMHSSIKLITMPLERKAFFRLGKIRQILEEQDSDRKEFLEKELSEELKITLDKLKELETKFASNDISLDKKMNQDDDNDSASLKDLLLAPSIEDELERRSLLKKVQDLIDYALSSLSEKERAVLESHWLAEDGDSLQTIADKYNVSREWIRQIELHAFEKIRKLIAEDEEGQEIIKEFL